MKTTKRALFSSVMALILCFSMLVGTTFAWFTDEVKSDVNKIVAGNLDVNLYHSDDNVKNEPVTVETKLFDDVNPNLWEPGALAYEILTVANEGTLALKYQLAINFENATAVNGHSLVEALKVAVVDESLLTSREAAIAAAAGKWQKLESFVLPGELAAEKSETYGIVIYWEPTENDNWFNLNKDETEVLSIDLGVHLFATQMQAEIDSFGKDYDAGAYVTNEDFEEAITSNEKVINVSLAEDVTYDVAAWENEAMGGEITETIIINGNGHTITFNQTNSDWNNIVTNGAKLIINNAHITNAGNNNGPWNRHDLNFACDVELNNVTSDKAMAFKAGATLNNVVISDANASDTYAIWIQPNGQTVTLNGCTIDMLACSDGRGIKIDNQYVAAGEEKLVTLNVTNTTFKTEEKAAILVKNPAGANITLSNVNIANTPDPVHAVWVDEDSLASYDLVTVNDGMKFYEGDVVSSSTGLNEALANGETDIVLGAGNYTMPTTTGDVTISGTPATVITIDKPQANNVALKGVTVVGSGNYTGIQHSNTVVFEDCVVKGTQFLYANKVIFKNCIIDLTAKADYIWTYGAKDVEFVDCTFNTLGKAILIYNEGKDLVTQVSVKNCVFNASASALAGGQIAAAIEIDSSLSTNGHYTLITENNTVDADFAGEWRIKKSGTDNTTVNGVVYNAVTLDGAPVVFTAEELATVLVSDEEEINVVLGADIDLPITSLGQQTGGSGEYKLGGENTKAITININGYKLNITTGYWSGIGAKNDDAIFTIKNGTMTSSQATGTWNSYDVTFANCNYVIENVVFEKAIAFTNAGKNVNLTNVTINETHDYYALWISAKGQNVVINGLTVNSAGRGIKIDEQYVDAPAKVTLNISNAKFTTAKKAAVMVKSVEGAEIILNNVDITGVAADATNAVWVDGDSAAHAGKVTVNGDPAVIEP